MNISYLLPSRQKRTLLKHLMDNKRPEDELIVFNMGTHQVTQVLNRMINSAKNEFVVLLNPSENNIDMEAIRENLSDYFQCNSGIGFLKSDFNPIPFRTRTLLNYSENVIKTLKFYTKNPVDYKKISIIIPFMYNGNRKKLFDVCIKNLHELIKDDDKVELVIHETGVKRRLLDKWVKKYNVVYGFTKWNHIFHRGWSLNYAAKHLSTGDLFVFMDADLIVDENWLNSVKKVSGVSVGWSEMINLNLKGTNKYFRSDLVNMPRQYIERIRFPNAHAAAGGINIYPKDIFYDIKGWCEDYFGTYGGEDNSTFLKINKLKIPVDVMKAKVYHLHHEHNTFRDPARFNIFKKHKMYSMGQWENYLNEIDNWGEESYTIKKIEPSNNKLNILWCKIDTSKRVANHYDDLLVELKKLCNVDILVQGLQNLHPATFQQKCLSHDIKREQIVKNHINQANKTYDFIVCANYFAFNNEKWDKITIPKAVLFEDQHGNNNHQQMNEILTNEWVVLHRYQFNQFYKNISEKIKCIWFPHSVDTTKFRNYRQPKIYDILQTGATYACYESRNLVKKVLMGDPRYHNIPRPKENIDDPWPTGIDYAKELNKAYMNVCCGSIYQYPVMKYFEIASCNSVVYGDYFPELGDLGFKVFENMIEIPKTEQEIKLQLKFLLKNKNRLNIIAKNGQELIKKRHTTKKRAKELVEIIKTIIKGSKK